MSAADYLQRVFLFDLDGTLTTKEILPEIAAEIGMKEELGALTREAIAGRVPYHESLTRRVQLLGKTGNRRIREIIAEVPVQPGILEFMQENRDRCYIVTANLDIWVEDFCRNLGFRSFTSNATADGDHVASLDRILDKRIIARGFINAVAVGDGHNDAGMLEEAEVGIACGLVHDPAGSLLQVATHAAYDEATLCRLLRLLL